MPPAEALPPPSKKPKRKKARRKEGGAGSDIELVEVVNPLATSQAQKLISDAEGKSDVPAFDIPARHSACPSCSRKGTALCVYAICVTFFTMLLAGVTLVTSDRASTGSDVSSWLDVPYAQMACNVAVIGSCAAFTIILSLPHLYLRKRKSIICLIFIGLAFITALISDAQRAVENRLFIRLAPPGYIKAGRGNCSSPEDYFPDQSVLQKVCPSLSATQEYVTVHPVLQKITSAEYKGSFDGALLFAGAKLEKVRNLLQMYTQIQSWRKSCANLLMDFVCNVSLPLCQFSDCSPITDTKCIRDLRLSAQDRDVVDACDATFTHLERTFDGSGHHDFRQFMDEAEQQYMEFLFETYSKFKSSLGETTGSGLPSNSKCVPNDVSVSVHIEPIARDHSETSSGARLTCDPRVTRFENNVGKLYKYNMKAFWVIVATVFLIPVLALGNIDCCFPTEEGCVAFQVSELRHKFCNRAFGVRAAAAFIGIFMGLLVFVGALRLQNVSKSAAQNFWASVYFFVSWLCIQGGMLVLTMSKSTDLALRQQENNVDVKELGLAGYSCYCLNSARCIERINLLRHIYSEVWEAGGMYFPAKLAFFEFLEIFIQVSSLFDSAPTSDAGHVLVSAITISANLLVLPTVIVLSKYMSASHTSLLGALLVVEVLFDKMFVLIIVFLRPDTITEDGLELSSQIVRHLGLLLPALLTALDMKDALYLTDYEESDQQVNSSGDNSSTQQLAVGHCKCPFATRCGYLKSFNLRRGLLGLIQASMALFGLFLGLHTTIAFSQQSESCAEVLGSIATCARPRLYFRDGIFQSTTCAWENVSSLNCTSLLSEAERSMMVHLPDAELEYSIMDSLQTIDVSDSKKLQTMPYGWAHVPQQKLNVSHLLIRAENCPKLSHVPPLLCGRMSSLRSLVLGMSTAASKSLDWNGQLSHNGLHLNPACEKAWKNSLKHFALANNNLTCEMGMKQLYSGEISRGESYWDTVECNFDHISKLYGLSYVNLRGNRIRRITKFLAAKMIRILNTNTSGGVSLEGNPLEGLYLPLEARTQVVSWLLNLKSANEHLRHIQIEGSVLEVSGSKILAGVLTGSQVSVLNVGSCLLGDDGVAELISSLQVLEQSLEYVNFAQNFISERGLTGMLQCCSTKSVRWRGLKLNNNNFTGDGNLLAQLLLSNKNMEELKLAGCRLPQAACSVILESVPSANKLRTLSLNYNCRKDRDSSAFYALLVNILPKSNLSSLNIASTLEYKNIDKPLLANVLNRTHLEQLDIDFDGVFAESKNKHGDVINIVRGRL